MYFEEYAVFQLEANMEIENLAVSYMKRKKGAANITGIRWKRFR
jgi:hypothetical protein